MPGPGASFSATFPITPGDVLSVAVGGAGGASTQTTGGGGGGGGTFIYDSNTVSLLAVAGGGGGAGFEGNSGGSGGTNLVNNSAPNGTGGNGVTEPLATQAQVVLPEPMRVQVEEQDGLAMEEMELGGTLQWVVLMKPFPDTSAAALQQVLPMQISVDLAAAEWALMAAKKAAAAAAAAVKRWRRRK